MLLIFSLIYEYFFIFAYVNVISFVDGIEMSTLEELCNPQMEKLVLVELQKHGAKCRLQKFEIPQALTLVPDIWTPDSGHVTAAFKLRRKVVQDRYKAAIDRMYS